jgi:hypothetical protein
MVGDERDARLEDGAPIEAMDAGDEPEGRRDKPLVVHPAPFSLLDEATLADFCARHHIRRLALFGSVLKGTDRPESDIDLLVEFTPEASPSLLSLAAMEIELSAILNDRRVDLRTPAELSRYFRDEVLREARVLYGAA